MEKKEKIKKKKKLIEEKKVKCKEIIDSLEKNANYLHI